MIWQRLIKATLLTNVLTVFTGIAKTELTLWAGANLSPATSRLVAYGAGLFVLLVMAPLSTWIAYKIQRDGTGFSTWWSRWRHGRSPSAPTSEPTCSSDSSRMR